VRRGALTRARARQVIQEEGDERAMAGLMEAATHKNAHVRQLAADALDRCQPATSRVEGERGLRCPVGEESVSPLDPFFGVV